LQKEKTESFVNETVAGVQNDGHEQIENTLAPVIE
jgi:hypothetical protein